MKIGKYRQPAVKPNWIAIVLCFALIGCTEKKPPEHNAPPEAIFEMAAFGATIAINSREFPESIDAELVSGEQLYVRSSKTASLYFSPHPEFESEYDQSQPKQRDYPYAYFYSQKIDGKFRRISPTPYITLVDNPPASYDGDLRYFNYPERLVLNGNHFVFESIFSAPAEATHVELWHRMSLDAESLMVRRVALSSFYAWRHYFQPLIEASP